MIKTGSDDLLICDFLYVPEVVSELTASIFNSTY